MYNVAKGCEFAKFCYFLTRCSTFYHQKYCVSVKFIDFIFFFFYYGSVLSEIVCFGEAAVQDRTVQQREIYS